MLAWNILRFDRRKRPLLRSRVWSAALVGVLLLPWAPGLIAGSYWTQVLKHSWLSNASSSTETISTEESRGVGVTKPSGLAGRSSEPVFSEDIDSQPVSRRLRVASVLLQSAGFVWIVGVAVAVVRRLRAEVKARRIVKRGRRVSTAVLTDVHLPTIHKTPPMRAEGAILTRFTSVSGQATALVKKLNQVIPSQLFDRLKQDRFLLHEVRHELPPGLYKLDVLLSDISSGRKHSVSQRLHVPGFREGLSTSLLILADAVEVLPPGSELTEFRIGNFRVRPSLPLSDFTPGDYSIRVTVTDTLSGESTSAESEFQVQ